MPRAWRTPRTTSGVMPRILPICTSEKPCRLALRSSSGVSSGAAVTSSAISLISSSWSTYQGTILVWSKTSSAVAPARSAPMPFSSPPPRGHDLLGATVVGALGLGEQRVLVELDPLLVPVEDGVLGLERAQRLLQR